MADDPKAAAVKKPLAKPKKGPLEMAEFFYDRRKLNIWLFASSLVLIGSCVAMVWQDYDRPWKHYQREFRTIERARAERELQEANRRLKEKKEEIERNKREKTELEAARDRGSAAVPDADLAAIRQDIEKLKADRPPLARPLQGEIDAVFETVLPLAGRFDSKRSYAEFGKFKEEVEATWYTAKQKFEFAQADYMVERWNYDMARDRYERALKGEGDRFRSEAALRDVEKKFEETVRLRDLRRRLYDLCEKVKVSILGGLNELDAPLAELKKKETQLYKERDDIRKKIALFEENLEKTIRDMPGLDFFAPTLQVRQVVLSHIYDDFNFIQVGKVDRCHTCHLGIDRPEYEAVETRDAHGKKTLAFKNPELQKIVEAQFPLETDRRPFISMFRAHPRLDLFVGGASPHKLERFGCTVCHGGDGRETDFSFAVHSAPDGETERDWKRRYGYHHRSHSPGEHHPLWDEPMLPALHVESSCRKCHSTAVELKGGERYIRGMKIFESAGCYACHKTDTYPVLNKHLPALGDGKLDESLRMRRPGPPLTHVTDKLTKEWTYNWILGPRRFRPASKMPHFFRQSNARSIVDLDGKSHEPEAVENAVAASIAEFLFDAEQAASRGYPEPPGQGNAERGKLLAEGVGCVACHKFEEDYEARFLEKGYSPYLKEFAPNLSGAGEKLNARWLFQWLKNPAHYMGQTRMPSLRLTDQESLDITAYLLTLKVDNRQRMGRGMDTWEPEPLPSGPEFEAIVRALVFEQLKSKMMELEARQELAKKDLRKQVLFLGRQMAGPQFGCYSCHEIKGFDEIDGIGVELTGAQPWGNKFLDRLDFGRAKYDGISYHGVSFTHPITRRPYEHRDPHHAGSTHVRIHGSRHDFALNKLLDPRVYDGGLAQSKPPDELLRMPNFNFTPEEAEAVVTFLLSFTHHEIRGLTREIKHTMDEKQAAVNRGNRIVRESNCAACHRFSVDRMLVESAKGKVWIEGRPRRKLEGAELEAELKKIGLPPPAGYESKRQVWVYDWLVDHRLLKIPEAADVNSRNLYLDGLDWWYLRGGVPQKILAREEAVGGEINEALVKYKRAHAEMFGIDSSAASEFEVRLAPHLRTQGVKTQAEWLVEFLKSPSTIRPNLRDGLMLPPNRKGYGQAVEDAYDEIDEDNFKETIGKLRTEAAKIDAEGQKAAQEILSKEPADLKEAESMIRRLRFAIRWPEPNLRMPTFGFTDEEALSLAKYFWARDSIAGVDTYPFTQFEERDPRVVAAHAAKVDEAGKIIETNCLQCHYIAGRPPNKFHTDVKGRYTFGPDLVLTERRLRPRWLDPWFRQPSTIYPDTPMTDVSNVVDIPAGIIYLMNRSKLAGTNGRPK
jgi:mono/diheme cytochrome c family protein